MVPAFCLTPPPSPTTTLAPGHRYLPTYLPTYPSLQSHTNSKPIRLNFVFQFKPLHPVTAKAAKGNTQNTKPNSVICADCDGNGAVLCSQCKGSGVNSVDFFNGKFKVGDSCWLCGGRKEMLCGNCNGAGFIGGFLSTYDQ